MPSGVTIAEQLRARELDRVLFDAAWRNERLVNHFRYGIWAGVGAISLYIQQFVAYRSNAMVGLPLLFAAAAGVLHATYLRRHFHRCLPAVLSTLDVLVLGGVIHGGFNCAVHSGQPAAASDVLNGMSTGLLAIIALNALRFSWPTALWTAGCAVVTYLVVRGINGVLDPSNLFDLLLIGAMAGVVVLSGRRFARVLEQVMGDLRRVQDERVASLAGLVAGITHELNTPLGALRSNAQTIERLAARWKTKGFVDDDGRRLPERQAGALEKIAESSRVAVDRLDEVVGGLGQFAGLDLAEVRRVDVREGLRTAAALLESDAAKKRVALRLALSPVPELVCRPSDLNQVFYHLIRNAIEATDATGEVEVRCFAADGVVIVTVQDTGRGIAPDRLERIFDPTLNRSGARAKLGLGLPVSYRIVRDHGGVLRLKSHARQGTLAVVKLPLHGVLGVTDPDPEAQSNGTSPARQPAATSA